jgi:hypothetical protein
MSDDNKSGWERLANELKNPWDWTFAILGGAAGAGATILSHGLDLGHSIPTGALAGVGVRRAAVASFHGRDLKKRTAALEHLLTRDHCHDLVRQLQDARYKWEKKIDSAEKFEKKIAELSDQHTKRIATPIVPFPSAPPYPPVP